MSRDWDGEDLVGFKAYQIPHELEVDGGSFPDVMQKYTYIICNQAGVEYTKVLAMIEIESGYQWGAVGSGGDIGYMQIMQKWHEERMEKLGCGNIYDPFQNIRVGVDYLAELLEKYGGSYEKALTAYQYGPSGAYKYWFSARVNASPYAKEVLAKAARIEEEMEVQADVGE
jgi:soluble lytic murein transglycosylase-like protein